ncbi:hypothetical protein ZOSMA_228G00010 [Zostera marina]|uniref:Uncharacterized protein n=1 Tax=Zostera marina TaxID=29655 RepID=A0A0K9PIS3_ZOSMR|nr:hypothetical protein ZOSMA_228G00010 [Zostera marina]
MNVSAYSCGDSTLGCSCGDCQSSPKCSDLSSLALPKKTSCSIKIGSLEVKCIELSSAVLYIILISIFLLWVLLYKRRKRTSPSLITQHFRDAKDEIGSHSADKKGKPNSQSKDIIEDCHQVNKLKSSLIQEYLSIWFRRYGKWVARNPILVLCFSLAIPLFLSLGLINFSVETQPEKMLVIYL